MNGFEKELKNRLLSVIPHGEIWAVDNNGMLDWRGQLERLSAEPGVVRVEPYVKATGMIQRGNEMKAVEITGVDPLYSENSPVLSQIDKRIWQSFQSSSKSIILGQGIIDKLNLTEGQKVRILLPRLSDDLSLKPPQTLTLTVAGGISIGGELDNHMAFAHLRELSQSVGVSEGAQGLRVEVEDAFQAPGLIRELGFTFKQYVYISDWTRTQGHLYQDIQLVRTVVYIALTLVIAVACFNIVSTLVMAVNEKQGEIAILKTMGAENRLIVLAFVLQGLFNGVLGVIVGVASGVLVTINLTAIASWIETVTNTQFLSADVYFIDFLPSSLNWTEVVLTAVISLLLAFLATLFPAKKAADIQPAEALGHY